jgi:hypothetical protein
MPPVNTMRRGASRAVTFTGNARPGETSVRTVTFSPSAIRPSTAVTPESQVGQPAPSVSTAHTAAGGAPIVTAAS